MEVTDPSAPPSSPVPLSAHHNTSNFDCGVEQLTVWLRRRAMSNQLSGASRTYVVCRGNDVVGYYALATGSVERQSVRSAVARQMPEQIPVILLARLALDRSLHGQGFGADLLQDALGRCLQIADIAGVRAVLVHAIDDKAASFYRRHGFRPCPVSDLTMTVTIKDLRASL